MNPLILRAGSIILLGSIASAQAYRTSPSALDAREGEQYAYGLGAYPDGRYMCFDGGFRGTAMTLKGTAYRYDDRVYATTNITSGLGRSWTGVEIFASECDVDHLSATYSLNPLTTPTRVFNAPVAWPDFVGKPLHRPADWTLLFPFGTNWAYSGAKDICLDYRFAGGTLSNNSAWSITSPPLYYKDSETVATEHTARSVSLGKSGVTFGSCSDRGANSTYGAYVNLSATYYGPASALAQYRDRLVLRQDGLHFGVSAAVITLLGFRADVPGTPVPGVDCNRLHIDTRLPTIGYFQISNTSGGLPALAFGAPATGVAAVPAMSGVELVTQAAWSDTRTRNLQISAAAQLFLPTRPRDFKRWSVYGDSTTATTGTGPTTNARYNEIARYTY